MTGFYFGYGSNLDLGDYRRWCRERGQAAGTLRAVSRAWLPDMEPCFHYRSKARDGGALDVRERRGSVVPGVLFEVDGDAWRALDIKEGASSGTGRYERISVEVIDEESRLVAAETYRVRAPYVERDETGRSIHVAPTDQYLAVVHRGLASHALPDAHLRHAAAGHPVPPVTSVFVYGTLMTGECREAVLRRHDPGQVTPAVISGLLLDLGEYPGLVLGGSAEAPPPGPPAVQGEVWSFAEVDALLDALDDIEDFRGYGRSGSLYVRTLVHLAGQCLAWTYAYTGSRDFPAITSGDWRRRAPPR